MSDSSVFYNVEDSASEEELLTLNLIQFLKLVPNDLMLAIFQFTKQLPDKIVDSLPQLVQHLPDLDFRWVTRDKLQKYNKFYQLHKIDIFKLVKDTDSSFEYTFALCASLIGIGLSYIDKCHGPVAKTITPKNFSIVLFPDDDESQQKVLEFFQDLSVEEFTYFCTMFNIGLASHKILNSIKSLAKDFAVTLVDG